MEVNDTEEFAELFELNYFVTLLVAYCTDVDIVRLSSCSRSLRQSLFKEVRRIQYKRRLQVGATHKAEVEFQRGKFLLCLSFAIIRACVSGNDLPLANFVAEMSFGSKGCHKDSVGYTSIDEIFDFPEFETDSDTFWYF